jgi:hypothetical protein
MLITDSQRTTPNRTVDAANGVTYAYRRLGESATGAPPLVLLQHFRGNLDNWDPALVDALATTREVILARTADRDGSTGSPASRSPSSARTATTIA